MSNGYMNPILSIASYYDMFSKDDPWVSVYVGGSGPNNKQLQELSTALKDKDFVLAFENNMLYIAKCSRVIGLTPGVVYSKRTN
ncbi:Hypothetical protein ORPV_438 [Orpheovirus IHUMI-LCC2]|uniref:Uncharacterized protein n=1 Tax=Orpheovirus IHUMI-LCC2 TaxID=2023057 RepID=A0A2I2L469_9VIRU|nr:Hypothetical protein ORPV_438 [Orpheovirus IHUMI-LCC2]SNW62342.1 Hypothetical protein ORPV_438 [Orpheovirus IHUMI-LCC2]